jgi:hypothetical protein
MTPREAFKYAFLLRCAEEGLTVEQAQERAALGLEKRGFIGDLMSGIGSGLVGAVTGAPGALLTTAKYTVPLGLGAMALGGAGLGYGAAKLQEGDIDPEEVQREELISAYRTQADLARRKAIMDAAQRMQPRPKSFHGI